MGRILCFCTAYADIANCCSTQAWTAVWDSGTVVKKILIAVALAVLTLSLAGCQTVQGLGRDITWTGQAGQEALEGLGAPQ